jgi:hypothetical protein
VCFINCRERVSKVCVLHYELYSFSILFMYLTNMDDEVSNKDASFKDGLCLGLF